jgi:PAS domain S-box-containing protein
MRRKVTRGTVRATPAKARAAAAYRAGEGRYRALFEAGPLPRLLYDPADCSVLMVNEAAVRLYGYTREQFASLTLRDLLPAEELPRLEALLASGPGDHYHSGLWRNVTREGSLLEVDVYSHAVNVGGRALRVVDVHDVTEERRSQQALRESEARLRALFAAMSDVILVLDSAGRCLELAPTRPSLLYRPAGRLRGRTLHEVLALPQADASLAQIRETLETGETTQVEYELKFAGRRRRYVATVSPLTPGSVIAVVRDITTQVEQYERLVDTERARADLAEHMNAEINHRARNNLAMVSGLLHMQALQEDDPRVARRLREAISRIRTFVDIHERIYTTNAEEVDLLAVTQQVARTLQGLFLGMGATLSVAGHCVPCPTRAATNLAVVTNELITNALKHGAPGAEGRLQVEVRLAREAGRLHIAVWSTGPPLPEGFDPGAQKGMGLRLAQSVIGEYRGRFCLRREGDGNVAELEVEEAALGVVRSLD